MSRLYLLSDMLILQEETLSLYKQLLLLVLFLYLLMQAEFSETMEEEFSMLDVPQILIMPSLLLATD